MAKIDVKDPINAAIESRLVPQEGRGYLGVSQLGHECDRYLWYVLHEAQREPVSPRTLRIWERGDWEEERVIKDLRSIGCTVESQQAEIAILDGKVRGHCDGIVDGGPLGFEPHLLEIKTAADSSWKKFYSQGLKKTNMQYWAQAQLYATHLRLKKILFCVVNKNDEQRYFEILDTEPAAVFQYEVRAAEIITATEIPDRIGGSDWWTCKMCGFRGVCHGV